MKGSRETSMEGKIVIVTGAGQGIGFSIADRFGQEGATVIIGELVDERGQEAAARLCEKGYRVEAYRLDVTKPAACKEINKRVLSAHGRIDVLVNNAGLFQLYPSEEIPEESWRLQMDVMLNGLFYMTQATARQAMIPQKGGSIVNIASVGGMGGWPMRSAYNAAKAGVIVLSEVLATEWAQHNIRVNCVSPGVTRTDMMASLINQGLVALDKYAERTPMGRVAEPSEIAAAVVFLASDRASFITGENLRVDGGWVPYGNLHARGFPEEEPRD